jgi:hypothetical protein
MEKLIIYLIIIYPVNSYWLTEADLKESEVNDTAILSEEDERPNFLAAEPPYNLTRDLERYLGRWAITPEGSFYFFRHPEPRVVGHVPGVVLSAKQILSADLPAMFEEAMVMQEKIKKLLAKYAEIIIRVTMDAVNVQLPRYDYLISVYKNETKLDETKLDDYDQDWIFSFAVGAIEAETVMSAYRSQLRKFNYMIKKLICVKDGLLKIRDGYDQFVMVFVETPLFEGSSDNMIEWSLNEGYGACQFVEASHSFIKYRFFNVVLDTKSKVAAILGGT